MGLIEIATGACLHYETWGQASEQPPVVVLHGMLGTATDDLAATNAWLASKGFYVIAPTLRGYGQSTPKPRDFPLRFYDRDAADVMAFMDALGIARAHLLGYSDGGEITLICAGKHPERFVSAASWGAVGYFGEAMRPVAQRLVNGEWITAKERAMHGIEDVAQFAGQWVRAIVHMIDSGGDVSLSLAPNITCPLLLMLGDKDTLNPQAYAEQFLAKVPRGKLAMFACGHPVHTEQEDAFRATVLAHLLQANALA